VATPPGASGARPASAGAHWAPERELVAGGLTFAALAAAGGDAEAARAAAARAFAAAGGGALAALGDGSGAAEAPPTAAGAAAALAAAAGALFDVALPRARPGVDTEVREMAPEVLDALQRPGFSRAAAAVFGALVGEVVGEFASAEGPLGGRAGTSYSLSRRASGGAASGASPGSALGGARPLSGFAPGRGVTPKSAFGGLPRGGAGTAAQRARLAHAPAEQELRLDEEEVLREKEAPVYGADEE
jgi:hypothetical protein